jgi:hypothetical protein
VEEAVQIEIQSADEDSLQSVQDRSLIDHLVATFHSDEEDQAPARAEPRPVYDLIRTEWPQSLNLGTRC